MDNFRRSSLSLDKYKFTSNKLIALAVGLLILLGIFFWIRNITAGAGGSDARVLGSNTNSNPIAKQDINKDFEFPLKDAKGAEDSIVKFTVQNAELKRQIVVKGQKANAIAGRQFLVINIKILNTYNQAINIKNRDYIRLQVNNNDRELLAPEIHNDPVEVQAQSTKYTRVAFTINETDKDLKLRIGEIDKDKTIIDLKLH